MWSKLKREAGRVGKQLEQVGKDVGSAVNEAVLEAAADAPLKEAGAREANIQSRLTDITPKLLSLNKRFQDLLANSALPSDYEPETIREVLGGMAAKAEQLTGLQKQVLATKGEINTRAGDGSSSRSDAKAAYDGILSKQRSAEVTFMTLYNELVAEVAAMNAEADEIDQQMQRPQKIAQLIHDAAASKSLWDALLANRFFPATAHKEPILAKLAELEVGIDSLLAGNDEPTYEQVMAVLNSSLKARAFLEKATAKAQAEAAAQDEDDVDLDDLQRVLMVSSQQGQQAVTGAGSLSTRVPSLNPFDDPELVRNAGAPGLWGT